MQANHDKMFALEGKRGNYVVTFSSLEEGNFYAFLSPYPHS